MASLNFPPNPLLNDIHTENESSWKWNGVGWVLQADITVSDFAKTLIDDETSGDARTTLGLGTSALTSVLDSGVASSTDLISSGWAYDHLARWHILSANTGELGQASLNDIGEPGGLGFGVGIYPGALPAGFTAMAGSRNRASDNYGNYQYSEGSIMCWIPLFYYRIGHAGNPTYPTYLLNSVDIKPESFFPDVAAANASGYALHRAFYDGGVVKRGFFVDKYEVSNNGGIASSLRYGIPLTTAAAHNPISVLSGTPTNAYHGCLVGAKTRGSDFFCNSIFIYSALALLSLAHGQAANGTAFCAWALASKNFPKGNNNSLVDYDDTTVKFTSNGHGTYPACAKTGSGDLFAKTTHNGQNSGVPDLNGNLWEVSIGVTCIASSKTIEGASKANPCELTITNHGFLSGQVIMITTVVGMTQLNDKLYTLSKTGDNTFTLDGVDSSGYSDFTSGVNSVTSGTFYAAKTSTAMKTFTSGETLATDHWGSTGVGALMEVFTPAFATTAGVNGVGQRYGNSTAQVLSSDTSGNGWILSGLGTPKSGGMSVSGTVTFGQDYFYQYIRNQLCLLSGGGWYNTSTSGLWHRYWGSNRPNSVIYVGFRCAAYL